MANLRGRDQARPDQRQLGNHIRPRNFTPHCLRPIVRTKAQL
jgi:hypothetical protein